MELTNQQQVENTRKKLKALEDHYNAAKREAAPDDHAQQLSLQSIKRMINQLTEEIVRYESRATAKR